MKGLFVAVAVAIAVPTLAPAAVAQSLADGMWSGTLETPDGQVVDIHYEVSNVGDALSIALLPPGGVGADSDRYEFSDIRFEEGDLVFWWQPGPRVDCVLEPIEDGAYDGECVTPDGDSGFLTMVPPQPDGAEPPGDGDPQPGD